MAAVLHSPLALLCAVLGGLVLAAGVGGILYGAWWVRQARWFARAQALAPLGLFGGVALVPLAGSLAR
ncbi:MAG: hypothetical protein AVDCRST_MAG11-1234 [uncultured Gemmatimonadaceae bacterium]|uniref:Uncharacterized protein n=1 Tax=uncultured Gemmatimonadaceae bacterium TaxID=246130 RepID=A0A6J4KKN9_9BACT|nr:MAG: hypothetical protein AVDCRST_MAG11-1234 [uncultured Gemmatimonadaceae bacterium]